MPNVAQLEHTPNGLVVRAPAKINLCLLIGGKRPDGFHEIKTIMAKVDWFDELLFQQGQQRRHRTDLHAVNTGCRRTKPTLSIARSSFSQKRPASCQR